MPPIFDAVPHRSFFLYFLIFYQVLRKKATGTSEKKKKTENGLREQGSPSRSCGVLSGGRESGSGRFGTENTGEKNRKVHISYIYIYIYGSIACPGVKKAEKREKNPEQALASGNKRMYDIVYNER